jgi:hypothetical protein
MMVLFCWWCDAIKVRRCLGFVSPLPLFLFTLAHSKTADFDEEVMEYIECMEDEVASQEITFMSAME